MDLENSVLIHARYCVGVGHAIKSIETKLNSSGARVLIKTTWLGLDPVRSVSTGFATCSQRPSPGSIRSFGSPALTRARCRSPDFSLGLRCHRSRPSIIATILFTVFASSLHTNTASSFIEQRPSWLPPFIPRQPHSDRPSTTAQIRRPW